MVWGTLKNLLKHHSLKAYPARIMQWLLWPLLVLHLKNNLEILRTPCLGWTGLHCLEPQRDFVLLDMPIYVRPEWQYSLLKDAVTRQREVDPDPAVSRSCMDGNFFLFKWMSQDASFLLDSKKVLERVRGGEGKLYPLILCTCSEGKFLLLFQGKGSCN